MTITIINDCQDANAEGRQIARTASLFKKPTNLIGVSSDIEAAGNLIDVLDALNGTEGVILVNVAPRNGAAKKWENGTPFGYFKYKKTLVVTSIDGLTLSLVKKLNISDAVHVLDIPTALDAMIQKGFLAAELKEHITKTQFRSFDFVPRAGYFISTYGDLPSTPLSLKEIPDAPHSIWWIDNFGNCKTTILPHELHFTAGSIIETRIGPLVCHNRLKDVPDEERALVIGSSGLDEKRFLEIVLQGGNAQKHFNLDSGDIILPQE